MVSNPERFNDNSPMPPGYSVTVRHTSARKSLCLFTELFYAKNSISVRRVGAAK